MNYDEILRLAEMLDQIPTGVRCNFYDPRKTGALFWYEVQRIFDGLSRLERIILRIDKQDNNKGKI